MIKVMDGKQKAALEAAIELVLPELIIEWNNVKLKQLEMIYEQPFEQLFEGRQTQEKTKIVSPMLDVIFARKMKELLPTFVPDEGKKRDFTFSDIPLELKINFTPDSDGWTGNGYAKTPWHMLFKFRVNNVVRITGYFAMLVNLDNCKSEWSDPGSKSNFSNLKFLSEDVSNLNIIVGSYRTKQKNSTGKTLKNVKPILKDV